MSNPDTPCMTIAEIVDAVTSKRASAMEITNHSLAMIDRAEPKVHAFLEIFHDQARTQAKDIDARIARGETIGPLAGVPIALKDNMCLSYGRTTCASRILENFESPYTATAVQKLIDAGAVIIGKTNLDEFAMGSSCEHSAFGPTRNPWDTDRVPGGSSGGSAAAVAYGAVPASLGSDTGGSIRQPAALTGIVGIKPTYGRISRYGLVAFASSLDQIGPFTRTVEDGARMLDAMCGFDPLDATSTTLELPQLTGEIDQPIELLTIGVPKQARSDAVHPAVAKAFNDAVNVYRSLGANVIDIDLAHSELGIAAYYIVAPAEASSNLARFDGIRYGRRAEMKPGMSLEDLYAQSRAEGFGDEVKRRIMLGTYALSSGYYDAYYTTALKARRRIKDDFDRAFDKGVHAVLMPSAPGPAFRIGEKTNDPLALYLEDLFTVGANLAGLPGISMPAGFAEIEGKQLPIGVQLISPAYDEKTMLRAARTFEKATSFHNQCALV
ncbi:MAG: Asp-tRNA(Asn)/Glu-tRNA(Gln) amidotransferase subunit GatA [Phycisphaerales bacterium]|nr:Asp-tRNA(Asn)/Glu-tRNA(Gln) amidotransferase subunit GatA [Phycisphaerales bacterium]